MAGSRAFIVVSCAFFASACGASDGATLPAPSNTEASIEVAPVLRNCPYFRGSLVLPADIPFGGMADVFAYAGDPDGSAASLAYGWSADSGSFSNIEVPHTTYRCDALGPRVLRVTARGVSGCVAELAIDVNCREH